MPNLSDDALGKLPPAIADIIRTQQAGAPAPNPDQQNQGNATVNDLSGALQRRFGQGQNFDSQYDSGVRGLMGEVPGIQNNFQVGQDQVNQDFTTTAQKLQQQNNDAGNRQQNNMANQGMGYSGANLLGQQRLGEAFQQNVFGANQSRTRGLDSLSATEANALGSIRSRQANLEGAAAERGRVRDEAAAYAAQQQQLETQRLQQEQAAAQAQLAQQQQAAAAQQQAMAQLEAQARAAVQPLPTPTGSVQAAPAPQQAAPNPVSISFGNAPVGHYDTSNSSDAQALKQQLANAGVYHGAIDGNWDAAAQQALATYQNTPRPTAGGRF